MRMAWRASFFCGRSWAAIRSNDAIEASPAVLARKAALESRQVANFTTAEYDGAVVSVAEAPTDGCGASIDDTALGETAIAIAVSPIITHQAQVTGHIRKQAAVLEHGATVCYQTQTRDISAKEVPVNAS